MPNYERSVFISYAWGGEREEIVDQIDAALQKRGIKIIRDKRDLGYKSSISEFMERIGQGNCVIVVISDKYLRSPNCMFELVEIVDGKQFHNRIFPIVLNDASIYDPIKRIEYVKYWEIKRAELAEAIKTLDPANLQGIREDMDLYDRIRDKISGLTSILKDMNTLTPEIHHNSDFSILFDALEKRSILMPNDPSSQSNHRVDSTSYDLVTINELLTTAFSDEALTTLVFEKFRAFFDELGSGMGKREKVRRLVEWCDNNLKMDILLKEVQRRNPAQFRRWELRSKTTTSDDPSNEY
jgi:hypothetical protein